MYLVVGAVIVWACVHAVRGNGRYEIHWYKLPRNGVYLAPGILLTVTAAFVRQHRWAVVTATLLLLGGVVLVAPLLYRYILITHDFGVRRYGWVYLLTLGGATGLLLAGLAVLGRQWQILRNARAMLGSAGFEVTPRGS